MTNVLRMYTTLLLCNHDACAWCMSCLLYNTMRLKHVVVVFLTKTIAIQPIGTDAFVSLKSHWPSTLTTVTSLHLHRANSRVAMAATTEREAQAASGQDCQVLRSERGAGGQGGQGRDRKIVHLQGLSDIAALYDAFLIDQWGVMHNGKEAYSGAVECINRLAESGKKIVLLSNSSKRKEAALKSLQRIGFSTDSVLDVVTSGQIAWDGLQQRNAEPFASLGSKCVVFGSGDEDEEYVTSCGCELAEVDNADFILARGSFVVLDSSGMRRYSPTVMTGEGKAETRKAMETMQMRGKPMLVTNPDFLRPGTNDPMPGLIGKAYTEMGGTTHYVGKPHSAVYETCFQVLQVHAGTAGTLPSLASPKDSKPSPSMVAIGDSLPHDILGAIRADITSIFVAGGVHFEELGVTQGAGEVPTDTACYSAFETHLGGEGAPNYVVPAFRW